MIEGFIHTHTHVRTPAKYQTEEHFLIFIFTVYWSIEIVSL